jgi:hypothetical protein
VATNTGGTASSGGLGTIKDDGSGDYFAATNKTANPAVPAGMKLDDDRALSVSNLIVNEASPYAVFTVTGAPGQKTTLSLTNGSAQSSADFGTGIEVFDPLTGLWENYATGSTTTLDISGSLLARTRLVNDTSFERSETFFLSARNSGGRAARGLAIIFDDGTGVIFNNSGRVDDLARKDDDRPLPAPVAAPQLQSVLCIEEQFAGLGQSNFISWLTGESASTDSVRNALTILGS